MANPIAVAGVGNVIDYSNGDPTGLLGGQQIQQVTPGALPAQWYTLFGISAQTAAAMNLQPTADQLQMFQAMQANPEYASIFQQSASAQGTNWSYTAANQALAQQAQTAWANGQLNLTPQQQNAANQAASPWNSPAVQQMMNLENNEGLSGQDAQSAILGTNQYQNGIIGAGTGATGGGNFQDVSPGVYTQAPTLAGAGGNLSDFESQFAAWEQSMNSAASFYENQLNAGVQQMYANAGENSLGISQAKISQNDATYASIQTPAEQQAWLVAQDPGNLSANLRAQWSALVLPQDQAIAAQNQTHEYMSGSSLQTLLPGQVPDAVGNAPGGFDVTFGSVVQQDQSTGRVLMADNVPTQVTYDAPSTNSFGNAMNRLGGATEGFFMGFAGGGPIGGVLGAVSGSGALGGLNGKNLGTWKWGQTNETGGLPAVTEFLTSFGIGYFAGGLGIMGRVGIGTALGSVSGVLTGGGNFQQNLAGGALKGGIQGGFAGGGPKVPYNQVPSFATGGPATVY